MLGMPIAHNHQTLLMKAIMMITPDGLVQRQCTFLYKLCSCCCWLENKIFAWYKLISWKICLLLLYNPFYQPRSGMVMQNWRSKKKKNRDFSFFGHCNLCYWCFWYFFGIIVQIFWFFRKIKISKNFKFLKKIQKKFNKNSKIV